VSKFRDKTGIINVITKACTAWSASSSGFETAGSDRQIDSRAHVAFGVLRESSLRYWLFSLIIRRPISLQETDPPEKLNAFG